MAEDFVDTARDEGARVAPTLPTKVRDPDPLPFRHDRRPPRRGGPAALRASASASGQQIVDPTPQRRAAQRDPLRYRLDLRRSVRCACKREAG
jgi:hypothetical protein